ncbi:MAG: Stp1/IreP family PP2C-type Ser/Thr phosphatase [Peptoniphilaceae bacterium]|uniref:Stp1/IreP family PP2C-type Ser/Thr phosphatase n=1 Tax=Parvimonas sp. TaxID=1944660 RepID=UPI0025D26F59|nr:Stp1/IreP family PP2C-type Ser/Thr phosphatase [Parvimonas sp.]MCI5997698.1 Stp1/IreP family PP2C-type Ser/Thr phosphatase [Parvimonas sp.]MDD7765552.1 Stp1/IreP family PP2C-type Ser/Thr phosphatase [Peptoniphilaceae bacterium]MDY3051093.1 Stp1/IreP family PP2C-type Ser/Thr phosphatase [Parvimonas sp.]
MSFYINSDKGNIRELNEDSFLFEKIDEFLILILADGMGGHRNGELASMNAVTIVRDYVKENYKLYNNYSVLLLDAFCFANTKIYEQNINSSDSGEIASFMGTTLEGVIVLDNNVFLAHVGDSRIYVKNKFGFKQITKDHSLVEYLYSKGAITKDEADNFENKNSILRAIGTEKFVEVDTETFTINAGDIILICSDGLTNELSDDEIDEVLALNEDEKIMVERLISMTKNKEAKDNITVGIFKNEVK